MKKIFSFVLCVILIATVFTACGSKNDNLKTGLAIITNMQKSKGVDEEEGLAQADSTAVAVIVDNKGVIKNIKIDVVQTKINFSATGDITTDMNEEFVSKHELKEAYGMKGASPISKEWYEQANALEEYVTGKTIKEVKGIALSEGYPTDEDLTSSVTMNISEIIDSIEKAVNNAKDLEANADDTLGLGIISNLGQSKNAEDSDGLAQAYTHYGAVTFDKDGKITSSIIDATQANISFSATGEITSDLNTEVKTKLELKDAYNMRGSSDIGKEWYEQSEAFSDYIKNKTASEVTGISLDEADVPTDEDLKSSVTIKIGDFLTVVGKAGVTAE